MKSNATLHSRFLRFYFFHIFFTVVYANINFFLSRKIVATYARVDEVDTQIRQCVDSFHEETEVCVGNGVMLDLPTQRTGQRLLFVRCLLPSIAEVNMASNEANRFWRRSQLHLKRRKTKRKTTTTNEKKKRKK